MATDDKPAEEAVPLKAAEDVERREAAVATREAAVSRREAAAVENEKAKAAAEKKKKTVIACLALVASVIGFFPAVFDKVVREHCVEAWENGLNWTLIILAAIGIGFSILGVFVSHIAEGTRLKEQENGILIAAGCFAAAVAIFTLAKSGTTLSKESTSPWFKYAPPFLDEDCSLREIALSIENVKFDLWAVPDGNFDVCGDFDQHQQLVFSEGLYEPPTWNFALSFNDAEWAAHTHASVEVRLSDGTLIVPSGYIQQTGCHHFGAQIPSSLFKPRNCSTVFNFVVNADCSCFFRSSLTLEYPGWNASCVS